MVFNICISPLKISYGLTKNNDKIIIIEHVTQMIGISNSLTNCVEFESFVGLY